MATTKKTTSTSFATEVQGMITGFTNSVPSSLRSMLVGGTSMTVAQIIAQFTTIEDMLTNVIATKAAWAAAVAAKKAGLAGARLFYENVLAGLKQAFGTNQTQLAAFGVAAPKPRAKPSSATKAIAHAKALATREARGTMGAKQKAAITTTPQPTVQGRGADGQPLDTVPTPAGSSTPAAPTPGTPATPAPSVIPPAAH